MTAEDIRKALEVEPELLKLAELAREKFNAKLGWLKTEHFEMGTPVRGAVRAI